MSGDLWGAGLTSNMASKECLTTIPDLLLSVNQHGVSDHNTMLDAYKELDSVITRNNIQRPVIVVTDGHSSRFDISVQLHLVEKQMNQIVLYPDTTGVTQTHDQINQRLHSEYEAEKARLYPQLASLNRESFMKILSQIWKK